MIAHAGPNRHGTDALEIIARRSVETMAGPIDDATMHHARRALVDWTGLALAGLREEPVRTLGKVLAGSAPLSPFVAESIDRISFNNAALLLGMASHVLDYDDTDPVNLVHCSTTLFPALFATATQHCMTGEVLLRAVIAGFEAESRLGGTFGRPLTASGWHVTGVLGHIGAALATSLAMGAEATVVRQAMGISATASSGLIAAFGTMSKALQVGRTTADGSLAAVLARNGFTGPNACFDERGAFSTAFIHRTIEDWSGIEERWGAPFAITTNSFKPYASCMITHPSIDAAAGVRARLCDAGIANDALDSVRVKVNRLVPKVAGIERPGTGLEGKFSVGYCVAIGLLHGRATPDLFADDILQDSRIAGLLEKIEIVVDETIGEQQSVVEVLAGAANVVHRIEMARGHPANPLSDAELSEKFLFLAEESLLGRSSAVLADLWAFERIEDVAAWSVRLAAVQN